MSRDTDYAAKSTSTAKATDTTSTAPSSMHPEHTRDSRLVSGNITGLTTVRTTVVMFSCCVGLLLSLMDASIVATAIYTIGLDLGSPAGANWVILGYMLAYVGFCSVFTRFCDVFGRKWSFVATFSIFLITSLGNGFCNTLPALIACRVLQGIGGSGLYALPFVIIPEVVPPKFLPFASTMIGMVVALAGVLGPILGGIICKRTTWRWIFWLNLPVGIVPLLLFIWAWPNNVTVNIFESIKIGQIDFFGCFLMVASSVLVVFAIQEAGSPGFSWSSPTIIAILTVGLLLGLLMVIFELFYSRKNPHIAMMIPYDILTDRLPLAMIFSTLFSGFTLFILIFDLPLRFQIVNLLSSEAAGIRLIGVLGGMAIGAAITGAFVSIKNGYIIALAMSSLLVMIGSLLLSMLDTTTFDVQPAIYGYEVIAGFGVGIALSVVMIMISLVCDFKSSGVTTGLVTQARLLGGSIGIAASSAVFQQQCRDKLGDVLTAAQIDGLQTSAEIVSGLNAFQLNAVRVVFAESFNTTLRICTYVSVTGFIAGLFCWRKSLPTLKERKLQFQDELADLIERNNAITAGHHKV